MMICVPLGEEKRKRAKSKYGSSTFSISQMCGAIFFVFSTFDG